MNVKKMLSLLLALCMLLTAVPALAAPTRDERAMDVTVDEKLVKFVGAGIQDGYDDREQVITEPAPVFVIKSDHSSHSKDGKLCEMGYLSDHVMKNRQLVR